MNDVGLYSPFTFALLHNVAFCTANFIKDLVMSYLLSGALVVNRSNKSGKSSSKFECSYTEGVFFC